MVEETNFKGKIVYQCEECKMYYTNKKIAEKCEQWCREHRSCNLLITKHAIKIQ